MAELYCFIKKQYFIEHTEYVKLLDQGNTEKQSHRTHLCIKVSINDNDYYIPLRNNLGSDIRKYGRIGHTVPATGRPNAGLDYRYALIVKDQQYIEIPSTQRIPNSQYQKINAEIDTIKTEFEQYLAGFIKAAKRTEFSENLFTENLH